MGLDTRLALVTAYLVRTMNLCITSRLYEIVISLRLDYLVTYAHCLIKAQNVQKVAVSLKQGQITLGKSQTFKIALVNATPLPSDIKSELQL